MAPHLHASALACILTFLEFMIIWIPFKLLCANFEGRSALASAGLNVL